MACDGGLWGLTGKYSHGIDAKGRLIIPSQLRKELGDVCYVARGADRCLNVYSEAGWQKFSALFENLPLSRAGQMRYIFANTATCEVDAQGRILLPADLRDYAGIGKSVTVIGLPGRAEIWDSEEYRRSEEAFFSGKTMAELYGELGL